MNADQRPYTILVAALGGEGGAVLADWLLAAAHSQGYVAQSTSIPGVSQRTGATTYYLEIFPQALQAGRAPVMALLPCPGGIDLVAASELVEAGRALQNAFVTPGRTTLIASSHRIFSTAEKMATVDGRYDAQRILQAAPQLAARAIIFDMQHLAREAGSVINAVLFGAMAGSGALPLSVAACEAALSSSGKGTETNRRGFALGLAAARTSGSPEAEFAQLQSTPAAWPRVHREFPVALHDTLDRGFARLCEYQDEAYAELYLDRLRQIYAVDRECHGSHDNYAITREAGRLLALWMSYEDVIRVAWLKTRPARFSRLRSVASAQPGQPLRVFDYLKPGLEEIADILPAGLAGRLRRWQAARSRPLAVSLLLQTSSVSGYLLLRLLSLLKPWRRRSARFALEQQSIERWLGALTRLGFASLDRGLVSEIAGCARLLRGYGETQRHGRQALEQIFKDLLENEAAASRGLQPLRQALAAAVAAGLADPHAAVPAAAKAMSAKNVIWLKAG